jgi:hypothetical protein
MKFQKEEIIQERFLFLFRNKESHNMLIRNYNVAFVDFSKKKTLIVPLKKVIPYALLLDHITIIP